MNTKKYIQPDPAGPSRPEDWVATIKGVIAAVPALGSAANVNRLMVMEDGLPYQRLGRRILFHVPTVLRWMSRRPGHNLPQAG
jgi:hypothetical protein